MKMRESNYSSMIGFEREGLRIKDLSLSKEPHPESLGSALCNKFITTDFAEAQLEFVTPPFEEKRNTISFLDDIHHFVSHKINDEIIWPFSMPLNINSDEDIVIASYGQSNLAKFKRVYRNGLSGRYGKMMQVISGIHYNYSVSDSFLKDYLMDEINTDLKEFRSSAYLNMLRNVYRVNWLILYLFGASPVLNKKFILQDKTSFKQLDKETFYLPYATSLRMSNFGYQNARRKSLEVSLNSISQYVSDLIKATSTINDDFKNLKESETTLQAQINENILQIDDEYYAVARAKSKIIADQRTTSKLKKSGIDFIELRSLDIDPFSRIGISEDTVIFLELLLTYCFVKQGGFLKSEDIQDINNNDLLVAKMGRAPNLVLRKDRKNISLNTWGSQIIENLYPIADILDCKDKKYLNCLDNAKEKVENPSLTLSSKILEQISLSNISFMELGMNIGIENKNHYLKRKISTNRSWDLMEQEARSSILKQENMEKNDSLSFQSYVEKYFES